LARTPAPRLPISSNWTNLLHDIHYQYGFTEAAGNFQANNYGRGGIGNDQLLAVADAGLDLFIPTEDGTVPELWLGFRAATSPSRASAFDSTVIAHEYGHGVSTRLTGGPGAPDGLVATQSNGMEEGWSDWWALMFTQKMTDTKTGAYLIGDYVLPGGVRDYPYSTDRTVNNLRMERYEDAPTAEHWVGQIWASVLWDLTWALIDKHGFTSNIAGGFDPNNIKGNTLALKLIMDALKLQPANPRFTDARDAILLADQILTGSANRKEIWIAFAGRGFGLSANAGANANATSVTEAFDVPADAGARGTSGNDNIRLVTNATNSTLVDVFINNATSTPNYQLNITGASSILVEGLSGNDRLDVLGVTNVPVSVLAGEGNDTILSGLDPDTLDGGAGTDTLEWSSGIGTTGHDLGATEWQIENVIVTGGVLELGATQVLSSVTISSTGTIRMLVAGTRVLDTNSLAIETTAKLDLNDNDLIIRSGNLATVTGQIKTGLENGGSFDWKGLGIGSTRRRPERDGG